MKDNTMKITLEINGNIIVLEGEDLTNESKDKFFAFFIEAIGNIKSFERLIYIFKQINAIEDSMDSSTYAQDLQTKFLELIKNNSQPSKPDEQTVLKEIARVFINAESDSLTAGIHLTRFKLYNEFQHEIYQIILRHFKSN